MSRTMVAGHEEASDGSDEDEHGSCWNDFVDCEFTFFNKWLVFSVGGLSFVAWNAWYMAATDGGKAMPLEHLLLFTLFTLILLVIICMWHYRNAKELKEAVAMALDPKTQTPANIGAALLEKTFGNLTDAIGYVLVEAWTATFPLPAGHPYWTCCICFFGVLAVVLLAECWERQTNPGGFKSFLDVLGQVILSGGTFFVVTPLVLVWKELTGTDPNTHAEYWVGFLAIATGVVVSAAASYIASKACHADGKEEDTDTMETLSGEKALALMKGVMFYTGGTLVKQLILAEYAQNGWGPWLSVIVFTTVAVTFGLVFEKLQNAAPLSKDAGPRAYALKFRQEMISVYMRVNAFIFSGLFNNGIKQSNNLGGSSTKLLWIFVAVTAQLGSLLLEECRTNRLRKFADRFTIESGSDDDSLEREGTS